MDETKVMPTVGGMPTREEHSLSVRKIWIRCIVGAGISFGAMAGVAVGMVAAGYPSEKIVSIQLMIVYILIPLYAAGYMAPMLATSLMKMSLGLEMSREGLDVGKKTADHIDKLQKELRGVLHDVQGIVGA